jgi:glutamate-1-semialdehyde aminotransferase
MDKNDFKNSEALLQRALRVTPVGAQTYSKSHRYLSGPVRPCFLDWGHNGHVWDVDGNEFVDFVLGLGAVILGYNNPEVNEAIVRQLEKGISFSQATRLEVELAERLVEILPCAEQVRFLKNGGDATTAAVRLARAATGRDRIACCGYHGMHDWYIGATALHRGVPQAVRELTSTFAYNDLANLQAVLEGHPGEFAAVILEPVQQEGPADGYLEAAKRLTHQHGAVLVFDEVVSGFRIALGGAQERYGVHPDLVAVGKAMANGMPLSAVAGKTDLLGLIEEGVFVSTTFGGETLSLAAALKTVEILSRTDSMEQLWDLSTMLFDGAKQRVRNNALGHVMKPFGLAPHAGFVFTDTGAIRSEQLLSIYQQRLLKKGILSLGVNNVCLSHTDADIERHLAALDGALEGVAQAVERQQVAGLLEDPPIQPVFPRN